MKHSPYNKQFSQSEEYNIRKITTDILFSVLEEGTSLSVALEQHNQKTLPKDRGLVQELSYGVIRVLPELEFYIQSLMEKVLVKKSRKLHYLIMVGMYQLIYTRIPPHAALSETVNAVNLLGHSNWKKVINGVLRQFSRSHAELQQRFSQTGNISLHPKWLTKKIEASYPKDWQTILAENNQRPPMWIRINQQQCSTDEYIKLLKQRDISSIKDEELPTALRLPEAVPVSLLPQFEEGTVFIQDRSAQLAAFILAPKDNDEILDLCAAPGGKTTHILELAPNAQVTAVDVDPERVKKIEQNLKRLCQHAIVMQGDGLTPEVWTNKQFDKILLDAPCSATGVIRRHPDIKWLRKASDIPALVQMQSEILKNIWPYLKPNGILLYATCSILPEENREQIERFLDEHNDVTLLGEMLQILPNTHYGDGFFYAKLKKVL